MRQRLIRAVGAPVQRALARRGSRLVRLADRYEPSRTVGDRVGTVDFPPEWHATFQRVRDYTLVSDERMGGLIGALEYLARAQVPGRCPGNRRLARRQQHGSGDHNAAAW